MTTQEASCLLANCLSPHAGPLHDAVDVASFSVAFLFEAVNNNIYFHFVNNSVETKSWIKK